MPEGDIVLRVARRLDQALQGQRLTRGELRWPSLGGHDLAGAVVQEHGTYGKHLLTRLGDGRTLRTHLRMDGVWRLVRTAELVSESGGMAGPPGQRAHLAGRRDDRSPRVRAVLATADWTALGIDLGMMDLVTTAEEGRLLAHLGPDVLAPDFDAGTAATRIRGQGQRPIAEVLLDQRVVAGLGTIYAAESLWAERLWPWLPADAIGDQAGALVTTARRLMLRSAVAVTPTATGDRTRTTHVHDRARRPCPRCGTPIQRGRAQATGAGTGMRPVFFCPVCQLSPH